MEGRIGKYCHHEDVELVNLYAKSKDREIIDEFYQRYRHLVYGLAFKTLKDKADTEDVAMDVWTVVIQDMSKSKINNFRAWLYIIVKNKCINHLRKSEHRKGKLEEFGDEMKKKLDDFMESDNLSCLINKDSFGIDSKDLARAIKKLPPKQRECIRKFYQDNLNYREVASKTGFELQEVKSFLQNGKRNLKMLLIKKLTSHE